MSQAIQEKTNKGKLVSAPSVGLRVRRETKKRIQVELAKINKKDFGRKVRCDQLIATALALLTEIHIKELQQGSMTNADRLEIQYRDHVKRHGAMSKDEFLGMILSGSLVESVQGNKG
ncbi:MAG: hypothetical protein AB7T49_20270 [Oligoflexales bacterium]